MHEVQAELAREQARGRAALATAAAESERAEGLERASLGQPAADPQGVLMS